MPHQETSPAHPRWAPRLRKRLIARLYRRDAQRIVDRELMEAVGYALLARCESILAVTEAARGRATCPVCSAIVPHSHGADELLRCKACTWEGRWRAYKKSYQHKQLVAGGMEEFLKEYRRDFERARSPREQMILIDTLLHRHHWETTARPSRPGATNLIQGKMTDTVEFLDQLSYGEGSTPEVAQNRAEWREKLERSWVRVYRRSPPSTAGSP